MKGWDVLREERYNRMVTMGIIDKSWSLSDRDPKVPAWNDLSEKQKERSDLLMSIYAAQIHRMDQGIGMIMSQLESLDKTDNTIIFFLSDNGGSEEYDPLGSDFWGNFWDGEAQPGSGDSYHSYGAGWANLSNAPFRYYKKQVHEGGIATPLIVRWPDQVAERGSIDHQPGHIIDIMATICDVANVEYPKILNGNTITPLSGKSIAPALRGDNQVILRSIFWEHIGNQAVRQGEWKLVAEKGEPWELYNLALDRSELNNLIESEIQISNQLKQEYEERAEKVGVN